MVNQEMLMISQQLHWQKKKNKTLAVDWIYELSKCKGKVVLCIQYFNGIFLLLVRRNNVTVLDLCFSCFIIITYFLFFIFLFCLVWILWIDVLYILLFVWVMDEDRLRYTKMGKEWCSPLFFVEKKKNIVMVVVI